jgi:hypothetical protein
MDAVKQPTQPGWYRSRKGSDWLLYSLDQRGQWYAHTQGGDVTPCTWDFISQSGPVRPVRRVTVGGTIALFMVVSPFAALAVWLLSLAFGGGSA